MRRASAAAGRADKSRRDAGFESWRRLCGVIKPRVPRPTRQTNALMYRGLAEKARQDAKAETVRKREEAKAKKAEEDEVVAVVKVSKD